MSNLAFWRASIWAGWDGSAGHLPYVLEAANSLLGAMRNAKTKETRLVERETHTRNPRYAGMELKLTVTHWRRRSCPKSKTLAFKNQFEALNLLQWPQKSLLENRISKTLKELDEMSGKIKCMSLFKSPASTNRSTGPSPIDCLVNVVNFSTFVHFLISWSSSCPF